MTRSQIANYESGRKQSLDVADLVALAAALDIAPLELLFADKAGQVEALPGQTVATSEAISRFTGNWDRLDDLRGDVHNAVDLLARVLRPAGISPGEQFGAVTVTNTEPPAASDGNTEQEATR